MLINHDFPSDEPRLTRRQMQVLNCLAAHMTSKEIARQLDISPSMVDQHLRAISNKLGGIPRRELARRQIGRAIDPELKPAPGTGTASSASAQSPAPALGASLGEAPPQPSCASDNFYQGFVAGFAIGVLVVLATMLSISIILRIFD